jgi:hypothetical protein
VNQNHLQEYSFDHLVIIGRDKLHALSQKFSTQGFQLTPIAHHNLGSINQLIMLDSAYIELLGWEPDKPVQRVEIANQALGLDALVFRTDDAQKTFEQLSRMGFSVNPVQDLSRESEFLGKSVLVQFKAVRFSKQPLPGIRIYFCEHLTPEYVWQNKWLKHSNQLSRLQKITITSPDIEDSKKVLSRLLNLSEEHIISEEESIQLILPNIELNIQKTPGLNEAQILSVQICKTSLDPVDFSIDSHFFQNL